MTDLLYMYKWHGTGSKKILTQQSATVPDSISTNVVSCTIVVLLE